MERGRILGLPKFFGYPLLSQQQVKLRTSNFVGTFIGSTGTKAHENIENSGPGRSQGVPRIFRAPICMAHCAVIFAIAHLSCFTSISPSFFSLVRSIAVAFFSGPAVSVVAAFLTFPHCPFSCVFGRLVAVLALLPARTNGQTQCTAYRYP